MQPYLTFDGDAAEALAFYARCLDGKITMSMSYGEGPMAADLSSEQKKKLMHGALEARGHTLMASDAPPGHAFEGYKGFTLSVQGQDVNEGEKLFNALGAGGKVTMPYAPTFWAAGFGMLVDQFGVPWMVNVPAPAMS